jgi:dolichyl-phosphate-mannose-protein mannosyltransferase
VTVVLITELLSPLKLLTLAGLAMSWAVALALALAWGWRTDAFQGWAVSWPGRPNGTLAGLAAPIVAIIAITGFIAAVGWPNTADSMSYHLARTEHWKQNASVAFYPTNIPRQLDFPPWAEYTMFQLVQLGGDERWANLVQWMSMLGSLVGVSRLAGLLGASQRGQLFSALIAATLPMGILQASSTQNDYATAFWLVCLATLLVERSYREVSAERLVAIGAALGLVVLTKSTSFFYAPPLAALYLLRRPGRWVELARQVALIGLIAAVLLIPFTVRNLDAFVSPLGVSRPPGVPPSPPTANAPQAQVDATPGMVFNQAMSPIRFASNVIRNLALHLGTPVPGLNPWIERIVIGWHDSVGLSVNDPSTTWREFPFGVPGIRPDETFAGNFPQLALAGVALLAIASQRRLRSNRALVGLALAIPAGFLIFCLIMKFQVFGSRLQLPLFVLGSPVIGRAFDRWGGELLLAIALVLSGWSYPYLLENRSHPLVGKDTVFTTSQVDQMFRWRPTMQLPYSEASELLQRLDCDQIGFLADWNEHEYQFWQMVPSLKNGSGRLEHVGWGSVSVRLASRWPRFEPCAVIDVRNQPRDPFEFEGRIYSPTWQDGGVRILRPAAS